MYAAQGSLRFDAEIAEKGHFWMETGLFRQLIVVVEHGVGPGEDTDQLAVL